MKVLALISGGKDSIFNIHQAIQHGHQLVALGNLYHSENQTEGLQLDSYMYQTVGTNITLAIAQALDKPIYRRKISGKPKIINLQYQGSHEDKQGDEVEDMFQLVKQVIEKHPQVNAISTGAIFSTYQKLRVENICKRLNLESLAYLWHRDQPQLLQQMIEYPLKAIIIKVASYGLKKEHLGKTITELKPYFMKMKEECQMNVCGEGGEFESLVLDCPLFKQTIVMQTCPTMIEINAKQLKQRLMNQPQQPTSKSQVFTWNQSEQPNPMITLFMEYSINLYESEGEWIRPQHSHIGKITLLK